ncbi:MAG TPA: sigma-70 family RNA polymerase sigma factor [Parasegetibacter sp.]
MNNERFYNEKDLFLLIAEGDEQAFSQLYRQYLPMLHSFLIKMLKQEQAVQEVIQETLIRIWLNRDKLPEVDYPRAWVSKIALRECYRYLRKNSIQIIEPISENDSASVMNDGQNRLTLSETRNIILRAIESLPERRKLIYILSRTQGLKIPEIAKSLGLSPGYVKNALVLALKEIRNQLAKHGRILLFLIFLKIF